VDVPEEQARKTSKKVEHHDHGICLISPLMQTPGERQHVEQSYWEWSASRKWDPMDLGAVFFFGDHSKKKIFEVRRCTVCEPGKSCWFWKRFQDSSTMERRHSNSPRKYYLSSRRCSQYRVSLLQEDEVASVSDDTTVRL
jgi:hypothetical protein